MAKEFYQDKNFLKALEFLYPSEGGFTNDPDDYGGRTNMGVTQKTYDSYRDRVGLPRQKVENMTKGEATKLYYEGFWKGSGADKIKDPALATTVFDTAVLHGPSQAKDFLRKSGGDINKYLESRKQHYDQRVKEKPSQKKFYQGWINRNKNLKNFLNKNFSSFQSEELKILKKTSNEAKNNFKNLSRQLAVTFADLNNIDFNIDTGRVSKSFKEFQKDMQNTSGEVSESLTGMKNSLESTSQSCEGTSELFDGVLDDLEEAQEILEEARGSVSAEIVGPKAVSGFNMPKLTTLPNTTFPEQPGSKPGLSESIKNTHEFVQKLFSYPEEDTLVYSPVIDAGNTIEEFEEALNRTQREFLALIAKE